MKNAKVFLKHFLGIMLILLTGLLIGILSFIFYIGLVPDFFFSLNPVHYSFEEEIFRGSEFNPILFVLLSIVLTAIVWLLLKFGIRRIFINRFRFPTGMFVGTLLVWALFFCLLFAINAFDGKPIDSTSIQGKSSENSLSFEMNMETFYAGFPLNSGYAGYRSDDMPGPDSDWAEYFCSQKRKIYEIDIADSAEGLRSYRKFISEEGISRSLLSGQKRELDKLPNPFFHVLPASFYLVPRKFLVENIFMAMNGNWREAIEGILDQIDFFSAVVNFGWNDEVASSSVYSKGLSIFALNYLLNKNDFPDSLYPFVYERLTSLSMKECDLSNVFLSECFSTIKHIQKNIRDRRDFIAINYDSMPTLFDEICAGLFSRLYQKNRTEGYFLKHVKKMVEIQKIPPYEWPADVNDHFKRNNKMKLFWWLQNSGGKYFYFSLNPNIVFYYPFDYIRSEHGIISCNYSVRAYLDLARITAEFHMKYDSRMSYGENIEKLESYKMIDPFSGRRYKYDEKRQILYSIGANRQDDKGEAGYLDNCRSPYVGDIVLPCKI